MAHRIQFPDDEGSYFPLGAGGDSISPPDDDSDQRILKQLGYKQELGRNLSYVSLHLLSF